ncbi:carboxypeptidase-like regulatory domain-containing protein [Prolixibacter sp. NT017]|uniref:carboxypeptidase-like regulatory domain-containing protein n=1 Tax=Prolixibacter sp. NT017 TaxID=2652390 RepID=UPI00126AFA8B|nr:carboxypeptidase-like regulatory domain-containing protein [Prolixibacter sp. NT017]GET24062.1 hypothetical protein NT017_03910 [Prolixibacter sp. NT017]
MKQLMVLFFLAVSGLNLYAQDTINIHGRVTDFKDTPLDSVTVRLKNKKFENLYETLTDKDGYFSMRVEKKTYCCLYAIRLDDYGKTKLEYWAWNIPAYNDLEINPKYERMEIYGMNAFEPQVSPYDTYMVYFRPMSLTKSLEFQGRNNKKELEQKAITAKKIIDIAPNTISKDELRASINGYKSEVIGIKKVTEYARGAYMYGFLVQIRKPENSEKLDLNYNKISIVLHSKETDEYGMGECFVKR